MQLPEIKRKQYDNGLVVLTEKVPAAQKACVIVGIRTGSINEEEKLSGIAHLNEHMLFKSNRFQRADQILYNLEQIGVSTNAFTSWTDTAIFANSLSKAVPIVLKVFFEMITNYNFDLKEFAKEKEVVLSELSRYLEDYSDYLFRKLFIPTLFKDTVFQREVGGTKETVQNISRKDLVKFKKDYYVPNRIVIAISGNFDEENIEKIVDNTFAKMEKGNPIKNPNGIKIKNHASRIIMKKPVNQVYMDIGTSLPGDKYIDSQTIRFISAILSVGMSSRLFVKLREEAGISYECGNSFVNLNGEVGCFETYAFHLKEEKMNQAIDIIKGQLQDLKENPISESELQKTKNLTLLSHWDDLENLFFRVRNMMKQEFENIEYDFRRLSEILNDLTPEKIQEVAKQHFNTDQFTITAIVPED